MHFWFSNDLFFFFNEIGKTIIENSYVIIQSKYFNYKIIFLIS